MARRRRGVCRRRTPTVSSALHPAIFDIIEDLQASRAGDSGAAARIAGRRPHLLTGEGPEDCVVGPRLTSPARQIHGHFYTAKHLDIYAG